MFFIWKQAKWEGFSVGTRMVRYDEADKIMFDILKDDWNDFGSNSNSTSIRIPTLRTLPGFIEKLKGKNKQTNNRLSVHLEFLFYLVFFSFFFIAIRFETRQHSIGGD